MNILNIIVNIIGNFITLCEYLIDMVIGVKGEIKFEYPDKNDDDKNDKDNNDDKDNDEHMCFFDMDDTFRFVGYPTKTIVFFMIHRLKYNKCEKTIE
jgi:hypothetical protein